MEASPGGTDGAPASSRWRTLCRLTVIVALAGSAALYAQYLSPAEASFCGLGSGCEAVRRSGLSYFFGSPLLSTPLVGLIAYGTVLWASLWMPGSRLVLALTGVGAASALALVAVQAFYVKAFCWLCLVVDGSAILAFVFAHADSRAGPSEQRSGASAEALARWAWIALAAGATSAPILWLKVKPSPPVPPVIQALYEPGKINVVEFADFECPFCRRLHPVLKHVLESYPPERVRFVRRHVPLPNHEEALPAARVAICAEEQGKAEALSDRLMQIELAPAAVRRAAVEVGVDTERLDRCLASKAPDARIDADTRLLESAGMQGLPTTYVQGKRLLGAVSEAALRNAFDRAVRGDEERGIPGPIYTSLVLAVLAGLAWLGRSSRGKLPDARTS